jgi:hypothetical protein
MPDMELPDDIVPSDVTEYLRNKRPGDQVTYSQLADLSHLKDPTKMQIKEYASRLAGLGVLVRKKDGYFIADRNSPKPVQETDLVEEPEPSRAERIVEYEPGRSVNQDFFDATRHSLEVKAREFFDLNSKIYRGIVVDEARVEFGEHYYDAKSFKTGVKVLTPEGRIRFGLVSLDMSERKTQLQTIADKMKMDDIVFVRYTGEFVGKSGKTTWLFEPMVCIRESDEATFNGEKIRTVVEENRILYLPVVEKGKSRNNVVNGVGYVENVESYSSVYFISSYIPVFVDGAGDKVGKILPEVNVRRLRKKREDYFSFEREKTFFIGELPMPPEEKTEKELAKIDAYIKYMDREVDALQLYNAIDRSDECPGIEKVYIRTLGLFKVARDAGMAESVVLRRDMERRIMSRIAAIHGLQHKEQEIIKKLYTLGSEADKQFMEGWPATVETYLNQVEKTGTFDYSSFFFDSEDRENRKKSKIERRRAELIQQGHLFPMQDELGFFAYNYIRNTLHRIQDLSQYIDSVNNAFGELSSRINDRHDFGGHFSMDDFLEETSREIDETTFWNIARDSFKGLNIDQTWKTILEALKNSFHCDADFDIHARFMAPYIHLFEEKVS